MLRNLVIYFLLLATAYLLWQKFGAPYREPGAYLETAPAQRFNLASPIFLGENKLFPTAWYQLDARIVAKKDYEDALSPVDLGVVWGAMADDDQLANISFRHGDRFLTYSGGGNIDWDVAKQCIANVHIIPADNVVRSAIAQVKEGDHVSLQGSLVQVFGPKDDMGGVVRCE